MKAIVAALVLAAGLVACEADDSGSGGCGSGKLACVDVTAGSNPVYDPGCTKIQGCSCMPDDTNYYYEADGKKFPCGSNCTQAIADLHAYCQSK